MKTSSPLAALRTVREVRLPYAIPAYGHPEWAERFPWLIQGTTARGEVESFDLGLFGRQPVVEAMTRWRELRHALGVPRAVHAYQVHGTNVLAHVSGPAGLILVDGADGHVTRSTGTLLTVSVADCVPVFIIAPTAGAVAVLHAGWRGLAGGVIEAGIEMLRLEYAIDPNDLLMHLGPAICGNCYEVGPEVHEALGLPRPDGPLPVDLRGMAARRALRAGVSMDAITISTFCTRCDESPFFSHRAGCVERQVGFIGVRG